MKSVESTTRYQRGVRKCGVSDCGGEAVEALSRVEGMEGRVLASGGVQAYIYI